MGQYILYRNGCYYSTSLNSSMMYLLTVRRLDHVWINLQSPAACLPTGPPMKLSRPPFLFFSLLQSAHMPMIDALMMAYTVEMISIEKVVASVKRFSTFSASKELPFDLEDAMVFWINKVHTTSRATHTHEAQAQISSSLGWRPEVWRALTQFVH